MKKRALISVSDKSGVADFASELSSLGYEILSTGGTFKLLSEAGVPVIKVSEVTGFPEILGGRVKTLHPAIHGGILAKREAEHEAELAKNEFNFIDIVCVNLYPFEQTIAKADVTYNDAVENIDIGGPTMLRASAKNHQYVVSLVDSADYGICLEELKTNGDVSFKTRQRLAHKTFLHTAHYDTCISNYLMNEMEQALPATFVSSYALKQELRYGENPHQKAAFYVDKAATEMSIATATQLWGKELSYNNILDSDAALNIVRDFLGDDPFVCILKHTNPCGAAYGSDVLDAYNRAVACDPVSFFGGIVGSNSEITAEAASKMGESFLECIVAPSFSNEAFEILKKKKNIRLLTFDATRAAQKTGLNTRRVTGGLLVQEFDSAAFSIESARCVTTAEPSSAEKKSLEFAWKLVKHVKSNAILFAKDGQAIGVGAGQMSRIDSTKIAIQKAREAGFDLAGSLVASDAFFPFRDSIDSIAEVGVTAVIQPGGSIRDDEVIAAADEHKIKMVFTGQRHFNH